MSNIYLWNTEYKVIKYDESIKEHPVTPEYIFRDYHNNEIPSYNFELTYKSESFPYSCYG